MVAIKDMEMPKNCYECVVKSHCGIGIASGWLTDRREDDCPLVEIEERKVGEWKQSPSPSGSGLIGFNCSSCGKFYPMIEKLNYCPNCGADMRGVINNG